MIIWKGWGILLIAVGAAALLFTEALTEAIFRDANYFQEHAWPMCAAALLTAAVLWPLGRWLSRRGGRTLFDPETGEQVKVGGQHSFFFIKLEHWAPIIAAVGLLALFA